MTTVRILRILGAFTSLSLLGCSNSTDDPDPILKRGYCTATGTAYCDRAAACDVVIENCEAEFQRSCCVEDEPSSPDPGSCNLAAKDPERVRTLQDRCVAALSAQACEDFSAGALPSACTSAP
jgi:hypothetical protein